MGNRICRNPNIVLCSFLEEEKAEITKVIAKNCMKKDLMKHGECVLHKVLFFNF